jgi:hypothetical protein
MQSLRNLSISRLTIVLVSVLSRHLARYRGLQKVGQPGPSRSKNAIEALRLRCAPTRIPGSLPVVQLVQRIFAPLAPPHGEHFMDLPILVAQILGLIEAIIDQIT